MNGVFKEKLLKILDIIDYRDNKENFVNEFVIATKQHALIDLIKSLPDDNQKTINQTLSENINNPEKIIETIQTYFTKEQRQLAFENAARNAVAELIQSVNETLSGVQKQKLVEIQQDFNFTS